MNAPVLLALLLALARPAVPWASPVQTALELDVPLDPDIAVDRIVDEALLRGHSYVNLRNLTRVAPHRLSGSPGAARAVEWARQRMVADGFENVRLEAVTVPYWERGPVEELQCVSPEELAGASLPILALGGSIATPEEGIEAEVLLVRSFAELATVGARARGKILLLNGPMNEAEVDTFRAYGEAVIQRVDGAVAAARLGAAAVLVRSVTTRRDDSPHTGSLRYAEGIPRIPAAAISTNGADSIAELLRTGRQVRLRLRLACVQHPPVESFNVVGEVVGREKPEEIVVVGAHLDAWDVGEGAHDDGAGCVQALEAVRLILRLGIRPRRTVRCVLFMNEENGLAGAKGYYREHISEMSRHVLAIESDRGGFSPVGFSATMSSAALDELEALVARMSRLGPLAVVPGGAGADIAPMGRSGVPLVGFVPDGQRYFDFHHSERDILRAVHPRELALGSAAITALAWLAAESEEPLPRAESAGSR